MGWLIEGLRYIESIVRDDTLHTFTRLTLAVVLGGIVGIEREQKHHPAGFRTHVVLCVGSALMMLTSIYMAEVFNHQVPPGQPRVTDPGRIAAQVVSGVGFLGGGAILRMGVTIRGLTTAASLWSTAGVGLAVGCGYYYGAVLMTLMMVAALHLLSKAEQFLFRSKSIRNLLVAARDIPGLIGAVERVLTREGIKVQSLRVSKGTPEGTVDVVASIDVPRDANMNKVVKELVAIQDITEVDIQ
jgi:putative Mg2+ transporter-C (MgtC) family protein